MRRLWVFLWLAGWLGGAQGAEMIALTLPAHMNRGEVWWAKPTPHPRAVVVFCPGSNESGEWFVKDPDWLKFAEENNVGLAALYFVSLGPDANQKHGYVFADEGSGNLLLKSLNQAFGEDLPLMLYGFSSGAWFAELFLTWKPYRVEAWCTHASGWKPDRPARWPPGIISCGKDDMRHNTMYERFVEARQAGNEVVWLSMAIDHTKPPELDAFVRNFFAGVLKGEKGVWFDMNRGEVVTAGKARVHPSWTSWLPSADLVPEWQKLYAP